MTNIDIQLKKLILDDDFTSIQNMVNDEINLMSILGVAERELQHSNLLAWLFDPNEAHGLGDYFIKEFIKLFYKENGYQDLGYTSTRLSVFDFVNLNFSDLEIKREHKNIDILITSKSNGLCILIENKIFASEARGQLQKYRTQIEQDFPGFKHRIYIYLSLESQEINEIEKNHYVQFTYGHIIKLIKQLLSTQTIAFGQNTRFVLEQYLQTLKSIMNENEQIEKVAKDLYKKYKPAFDLVFKYASPSGVGRVPNNLEELVRKDPSLRPFSTNGTYVRFQPNFLYNNIEKLKAKGLISPTDELVESWLFLFEFHVTRTDICFYMKIGAYDDSSCREKLYNLLLKHKDVFNQVEKAGKLSPAYHKVFLKKIITTEEYSKSLESEDVNLDAKIETRFRELIDDDLKKIQIAIEMEL